MHNAKICLRAYVDSNGPDQPEHPRSLIGAFAVLKQNHWILQNVSMDSKCIGLDKGGYLVNIFLISPRKHMLWVLIRSALARLF